MTGELLPGALIDWDFVARQRFPLELRAHLTGTAAVSTVLPPPVQRADTPRRRLIAAGIWRRP